MGKNQHVLRTKAGWAVKGEGNSKATKNTSTQKEAISVAKQIAINQESEVIIHDKKNRIRDKDSYGNDPKPPKDKKH